MSNAPETPQVEHGEDARARCRPARAGYTPPSTAAGPLPAGPYSVVMADPPWIYTYETRTTEVPGTGWLGAGERHYDTMRFEEIAALPVGEVAADDAVLWLWITNPLMAKGFELIERWGFSYRGLVTWIKTTKSAPVRPFIGNGYWLRGATEHMMLAVRGKPKPLVKDQPTWFAAPPGRHSAKPIQAHEIAERYSEGPRLEMFARRRLIGWDVWGNEVGPDTPATRQAKLFSPEGV